MAGMHRLAPHLRFWAFDLCLAGSSLMFPDIGPFMLGAAAILAALGLGLYGYRWFHGEETAEDQPPARGTITVSMGDGNTIGDIGHKGGGASK
jgi:hypothetical protein